MAIPQLNAGSRMAALTARILKAANGEEARKVVEGVKGGVLQSKLKRKVVEAVGRELPAELDFLRRDVKTPVYRLPDATKRLSERMEKWEAIRNRMEAMEVTIGEYREKRREEKGKEKKNKYPF